MSARSGFPQGNINLARHGVLTDDHIVIELLELYRFFRKRLSDQRLYLLLDSGWQAWPSAAGMGTRASHAVP